MTMTKTETAQKRALEGRTPIVTGSTSGIGLGIARALAGQGSNLVLNGFGAAAEIAALRDKLAGEHDVNVMFDGADMSKPEAIERMVAHAAEAFGAIDILVNNAGIQHVAPIAQFPPAKRDAIIAINLSAAFHATRAVFARMTARGRARSVN